LEYSYLKQVTPLLSLVTTPPIHCPTAGRLSALWSVISSLFFDDNAAAPGGGRSCGYWWAVLPGGRICHGQSKPVLIFRRCPGYASHHASLPTLEGDDDELTVTSRLVSLDLSLLVMFYPSKLQLDNLIVPNAELC
jgi:hypothetical protein